MTEFVGAKAALICDGHVLTYLRDDRPGLPWPAHWDLPGGAREGHETAEECLFRELSEEFGLTLSPGQLFWQMRFPALHSPGQEAVFFAGHLSPGDVAAIRFGTEGQFWRMRAMSDWLAEPLAVPDLQRRTALAVHRMGRHQS